MSSVIVLTPLIIAGWPAITSAVTAAVSTMGYALCKETGARRHLLADAKTKAEIEIENSEILEAAAGTGEELIVEKDGIRAVFSRDARGALKVCMEGVGYSKQELRRLGQELIGRVTQQYVYHKMITELRERKLAVVGEEVAKDRTIKLRVRNW
ncbi:MAG TPA: hypothetical protein VKU02_25090 [Gemmataceae bacterium]|nr:hypothetical protein [Gemmataceae bacterium]